MLLYCECSIYPGVTAKVYKLFWNNKSFKSKYIKANQSSKFLVLNIITNGFVCDFQ